MLLKESVITGPAPYVSDLIGGEAASYSLKSQGHSHSCWWPEKHHTTLSSHVTCLVRGVAEETRSVVYQESLPVISHHVCGPRLKPQAMLVALVHTSSNLSPGLLTASLALRSDWK